MAAGPGKYDDLCTLVREKTNAVATLVMVCGGDRGTGFSVQIVYHPSMPPMVAAKGMRDAMRSAADQLEQDIRQLRRDEERREQERRDQERRNKS